LPAKNLPILKARLQELLLQQVSREELRPKITLDAEVTMPDLTKKFIDDLAHIEPFGNQNSHPSFYVKDAVIVQKPMMLKDAHVKCSVFADGVIKPVIFFNRPELFQTLNDLGQDSFDLAVQVNENHWNGRVSIELQGIDIALK
jgi:single-stranded-DNA-specific exonuclease